MDFLLLRLVPLLVLAARARICSLTCINDFFFLSAPPLLHSAHLDRDPGHDLPIGGARRGLELGPMGCKGTRSYTCTTR